MNKDNAKKMLFALASPEEKQEMSALEIADLNKNYQKFDKSFNAFEQSLQRLSLNVNSNAKSSQIDATVNALTRNLEAMRQSMESLKIDQARQIEVMAKAMTSIVGEMKDEMVGSIGRVRGVLENQNAGPLYKTMINALAGVKESIEKKPVPVWNWPQYASVSVRDKSFANIDPSVAYQNSSSTPATPYGTTLAYDNAGTITVVSSTNKLPVNASVTIASSTLSGLQVNISKATTSVLSGVQTVLNGSNKTIPVSLSGNQAVNIAAASTSVLAGVRVFVNNPSGSAVPVTFSGTSNVNITAATTSVLSGVQTVLNGSNKTIPVSLSGNQAVNIAAATTSVLSGIQINNNTIRDVAIDVNTGNASVGTQRVVLASNQPNVPVNIAAATTSILSGVQLVLNGSNKTIPVSLSGNQAVNIAAATTSVLSGVQTVLNGSNKTIPVSLSGNQAVNIAAATTSVLSGVKVVLNGSLSTVPVSISGNQAINIAAASTSVLAGIKVQVKNDSLPFVTTTTVGIAASSSGDNTIVGAQTGKQIFVYAWNISFSGTVNAKFTDGASGKLLGGLYYGVANAGGGNAVTPNLLTNKPEPSLFHTSTGNALILNLSGATAVGGSVSFFLV